jgi:protein-L-isoaspartate(D-aspartate) O-methyltransferase
MTSKSIGLRIALVAVVVIALGWLLIAHPWQVRRPATPVLPTSQTGAPATPAVEAASLVNARHEMVEAQIRARGVSDLAVLVAVDTVPRHLFVPSESAQDAYADHPLPIGYGQTISQPYIVAWMTELLRLKPGDRVLEIGTGSGYQAAILAEMGAEVYTIEIVEPLAAQAAGRLAGLGYQNVTVLNADGYYGWEEYAPFDGIIVTAAPDHLPAPLVAQLVEGGRLVIPIGPPGGYQSLWKFVKENGEVKAYNMGGVAFVPLTGGGIEQEMPAPEQ